MNHAEQLDGLIAKHEGRAEKLRTLKTLLADDPELMTALRQLLFPPGPPPQRRVRVITDFLRSKGDWQSARQIAQGTGLPRNTVNFLLFASKEKGVFDSKSLSPKKKVWRLKPGAEVLDDGIIRIKLKPKAVKPTKKLGS